MNGFVIRKFKALWSQGKSGYRFDESALNQLITKRHAYNDFKAGFLKMEPTKRLLEKMNVESPSPGQKRLRTRQNSFQLPESLQNNTNSKIISFFGQSSLKPELASPSPEAMAPSTPSIRRQGTISKFKKRRPKKSKRRAKDSFSALEEEEDRLMRENIAALKKMKNVSLAITKAFDILFVSTMEFKIEIQSSKLKLFILSYAMYLEEKREKQRKIIEEKFGK